jgi:hypothetical protein
MSACINPIPHLRPLRDRDTNDPLTITLRIYMMYIVMEDMKLKLCQLDTLLCPGLQQRPHGAQSVV